MSRPDLERLGAVYPRYLNAVVLHGLATAQAVGLGATDLYAIGALTFEGRMTSGELAAKTGLTTGATTRLIDRLEQRGLVRRVPDPADRRRVLVEAVEDEAVDLDDTLAPAREKLGAVFASCSPEQIAALTEHFERATPAFHEAIEAIRKAE
ncbi:MarR family winged helix-turn-helix transcriptional regulator [Glycomyces harbinensis]|uniref:DNA-binding transcriptional regulator, MarR family n=1 Tax=Glycomyces harbinensis TaxID=58114 RepID=A0A1G6WQY5_9ACTN|nr:MarR family transcriptional regulator [Glycomyces harbinensis]SDD68199.1 DNA-binding transcriptional regulator, MarR family [Glycomyces harbinensis]